MTTSIATLDVCGDVLRVYWTGSVWESRTNGSQYSSATAAMRVELEQYLGACGEDVESDAVQDQIEGWLSQMTEE